MKHKLWRCVSCGNLFLWHNQGHNIGLKNCPHCTLDEWIECTDLQLVPVGEYEALLESNHGKDCAIAELSAELEKLVPVEQPDKGCEGCEYESDGCCMNRNIDDEKIETKDCFTPKPEPQEQQDLKLKRLCGEERISKIHTQLLTMIIDQQQQIDAINTRLDRLEKVKED